MRILVIEDEPALANVIARAFREEEYAVDEAADGEVGLSKATTWDYDAIIMDVMLPKHDGWWVLMHLRRTHKTPVLMLTACDTVYDKVKGLDLGADDYLVKPFDLLELLARVRALIRRAADQPNPIIKIQDIHIDTGAKQVLVSGRLVVLTAREYAILELLARNRGRVVTRTQIYDHIFDETDDTFSNIVEVHVSNVRKKLGHDIIVTRRGLGYLIDA